MGYNESRFLEVLMRFIVKMTLLFALIGSLSHAKDCCENEAVILLYHRFGDDRYPSTNIKIEQFKAQLEHLQSGGYHVLPLSQILKAFEAKSPLPPKSVAITVDDGYKTILTNAHPLLKRYGYPYTVFVNPSAHDNASKNFLTWDEMRRMQAEGVEFANHSATHENLLQKKGEDDALWRSRVSAEVRDAQKRLQSELGERRNTDPKIFSYPFGEFDEKLKMVLHELGYYCMAQTSGAASSEGDMLAIPRFAISQRFADMEDFKLKLATRHMPIAHLSDKKHRVSHAANPPLLIIELKKEIRGFGCYDSLGEPLEVQKQGSMSYAVKSKTKLKPPRDRYTCTAKAENGGWYWYSHLWVVED